MTAHFQKLGLVNYGPQLIMKPNNTIKQARKKEGKQLKERKRKKTKNKLRETKNII